MPNFYILAIENVDRSKIKNFVQKIESNIQKVESKISDLRFQLDITQNQLKTLPSSEEIEDKRQIMTRVLTQRVKDSYLESGAALKSLTFSDKKEVMVMFFGGKDENGKKYGIYIRRLGGKPAKYKFQAYGRIGLVQGVVDSRCKEYETDAKPNQNDDDKVLLNKTAQIIFDANPELKIKEDMPGLDQA